MKGRCASLTSGSLRADGGGGVGGLDRGVGRKDRVSVSPFSVVFYPVTTRAVSSLVTVVPAEMIRAVISSTLPSQQFSSIQSFTELFIHRGDFPSFSLSLCCHLCCFNDILTVGAAEEGSACCAIVNSLA